MTTDTDRSISSSEMKTANEIKSQSDLPIMVQYCFSSVGTFNWVSRSKWLFDLKWFYLEKQQKLTLLEFVATKIISIMLNLYIFTIKNSRSIFIIVLKNFKNIIFSNFRFYFGIWIGSIRWELIRDNDNSSKRSLQLARKNPLFNYLRYLDKYSLSLHTYQKYNNDRYSIFTWENI